MSYRSRALVVLLALAALTACDDDDEIIGPRENEALVRFANATNAGIDLRNAGTLSSANQDIGFGEATSCLIVNTTGATGTGLQFSPTGTSTSLNFTQNLQSRGNYTIVAYPGTTAGTTQFITLDNTGFTPASGQAGIRVVNVAPGSGALTLRQGGTAVGTGAAVGYGNAGSFAGVNSSASTSFTLTTGSTTAATTGNLNLAAGQNYTLVVAPAASGSTTLRTFLLTGC